MRLVAEGAGMISSQRSFGRCFRPDTGPGPAVVEEEEPGGIRKEREKVGGGGLTGVGNAEI